MGTVVWWSETSDRHRKESKTSIYEFEFIWTLNDLSSLVSLPKHLGTAQNSEWQELHRCSPDVDRNTLILKLRLSTLTPVTAQNPIQRAALETQHADIPLKRPTSRESSIHMEAHAVSCKPDSEHFPFCSSSHPRHMLRSHFGDTLACWT